MKWLESAIKDAKCVEIGENGSLKRLPGSETFQTTLSKASFLLEVSEWAYKNRILLQRDALSSVITQLRFTIEDIVNAERRSSQECET